MASGRGAAAVRCSSVGYAHQPRCRFLASLLLRGAAVHRHTAEAGSEFLGALQRSFALFETGAMIPEVVGKGRIALERLPTAGAFFPLECIAEL
jgi:hypothetical protein